MGHFRESSYAYLLFKSGIILTTITSTSSIHKGKTTTATINAKKSALFLPVTYKGEGISASRKARELILGSNWGIIQFPIHWYTLRVWWPHQGRTLTVERSTLSALSTKLAFPVIIGWQPIVGGGGSVGLHQYIATTISKLLSGENLLFLAFFVIL